MLGRTVRFSAGFVIGVLALPLMAVFAFVAVGGFWIATDAATSDRAAEIDAAFWTEGRDVSRAGGTSVTVRGARGEVARQTCREACDDLVFWSGAADRVEVKTADGACLLCQEQRLRLPFTAPKRWGLSGDPMKLNEEPWR